MKILNVSLAYTLHKYRTFCVYNHHSTLKSYSRAYLLDKALFLGTVLGSCLTQQIYWVLHTVNIRKYCCISICIDRVYIDNNNCMNKGSSTLLSSNWYNASLGKSVLKQGFNNKPRGYFKLTHVLWGVTPY